jgi:lipoprotein-anchoring transpeptidase ErfK/SrfK
MKALAALLFLVSTPSFALDFVTVREQLPALGVSPAEIREAAAPEASPAEDAALEALRAEALADPAGFIDSHTPYEVGQAFGLPASRFLVTDKARIERALVKLTVDLTRQRLVMTSSGTVQEFKISSGLAPKNTTPGSGKCYAPDFLEEMHYSSLYNKAPMPHSIFFNGNIAMHGTEAEWLLGKPASHGCVRLSKVNAKIVHDTVKANGKANAIICVTGATPQPK